MIEIVLSALENKVSCIYVAIDYKLSFLSKSIEKGWALVRENVVNSDMG